MRNILIAFSLTLLTNCATIIDGTDQAITITSNPDNAHCVLWRNNQNLGSVTTPDEITIEKTKRDIKIVCSKSGYKTVAVIDKSGTDKWAFANALILSPVLAGADSASGADNKYDSPVNIKLIKE